MKCVSVAMGEWMIFDDNMKTHDNLPPNTYVVRFSKGKGFYLKEQPDLTVDVKLYGEYTSYADKILEGYKKSPRSVGVLFSGSKGMGKSITTRYIATKAKELNLPVIIVDEPYLGLPSFLQEIRQECLIIFDEFEKNFPASSVDNSCDQYERNDRSNAPNAVQEDFLSFFDGIGNQKLLYCITCNQVSDISLYLLNRPGRIHYHIQFENPTAEDIERYLKDNVKPEYHEVISEVVAVAPILDISYDVLEALAFEFNIGRSFKEAMKLLNISMNSRVYGTAVIEIEGIETIPTAQSLDFDSRMIRIQVSNTVGQWAAVILVSSKDFVFDKVLGKWSMPPEKIAHASIDDLGNEYRKRLCGDDDDNPAPDKLPKILKVEFTPTIYSSSKTLFNGLF